MGDAQGASTEDWDRARTELASRRDQSSTRSRVGVVEWDAARSMVKVNPLAGWTQS